MKKSIIEMKFKKSFIRTYYYLYTVSVSGEGWGGSNTMVLEPNLPQMNALHLEVKTGDMTPIV